MIVHKFYHVLHTHEHFYFNFFVSHHPSLSIFTVRLCHCEPRHQIFLYYTFFQWIWFCFFNFIFILEGFSCNFVLQVTTNFFNNFVQKGWFNIFLFLKISRYFIIPTLSVRFGPAFLSFISYLKSKSDNKNFHKKAKVVW
jgi:hypothetical protein